MPAALIVGGIILLREMRRIAAFGKDAGKQAGEAISRTVFDVMNPSVSSAVYNKPTKVAPMLKNEQMICPPGYVLKYGAAEGMQRGVPGWYCLRTN